MPPHLRLRRQVAQRAEAVEGSRLFADASCILSDATLDWLIAHPGMVLRTAHGRPLALVTDRSREVTLADLSSDRAIAEAGFVAASADSLHGMFNRKLRRQQDGLAMSVAEQGSSAVEWALFKDVYKGITDIITRYVWPVPAFWIVRLCARLGITPNAVTLCSVILTFVVGALFYQGAFALGLGLAWLMTFLDTVDGKLARVTCTSSKFGDLLDHVPDVVHPPIWWICFGLGLNRFHVFAPDVQASCIIILVTYVLGRLCELFFKKRHGFNQYLWTAFDGKLRMIIARRNTILAILTGGALLGTLELAYHMAAVWSVVTIGIQAQRCIKADAERRRGREPSPWLMQA